MADLRMADGEYFQCNMMIKKELSDLQRIPFYYSVRKKASAIRHSQICHP